jgi:hypothetical protein
VDLRLTVSTWNHVIGGVYAFNIHRFARLSLRQSVHHPTRLRNIV